MARKKNVDKLIPARTDLLNEEERAALTAEARKSIVEEMAQDARDAFFASEMERLRAEQIPAETIVNVTMDLAPFVTNVMIDGVQFFHGFTYPVPHCRRIVLLEQMQKSWQHQDEIDGRSRFNSYRRPQNLSIGLHDMGTPTRGANGVVSAEV